MSLVLSIKYQKLVEIVVGGGFHWVFSGPPRRQEMEATAVVLHLDLELELGFRMDPEEPGSLTFPLF